MAWCFTEEATEFSEMLLSRLSNLADTAVVPALWLYEVVNVTELAVRKGRITDQKVREFLESLADLPIEIENPTQAQNVRFGSRAGRPAQAHRIRRVLS
jgi:predicted nucleic acid-binding protein